MPLERPAASCFVSIFTGVREVENASTISLLRVERPHSYSSLERETELPQPLPTQNERQASPSKLVIGERELFDEGIFACHTDALRSLTVERAPGSRSRSRIKVLASSPPAFTVRRRRSNRLAHDDTKRLQEARARPAWQLFGVACRLPVHLPPTASTAGFPFWKPDFLFALLSPSFRFCSARRPAWLTPAYILKVSESCSCHALFLLLFRLARASSCCGKYCLRPRLNQANPIYGGKQKQS